MEGSGKRILLVEDEAGILRSSSLIMERNGYQVFAAATAREALEIFERESGRFDLIFTDVVLTDQSGLNLVDRLISRNRRLKVILTSGYTDKKSQWSIINERGFHFLSKPYNQVELLRALRAVLKPASKKGRNSVVS